MVASHSDNSESGLERGIVGVFREYYNDDSSSYHHYLSVKTVNPWGMNISFLSGAGESALTIRNITQDDVVLLESFKHELSDRSRELFCPYPWNNIEKLREAVTSAVRKSVDLADASYIISINNKPIGHFFLWGAGGNSHSLRYGVDIPELGVAIADSYQGKGLGFLAVRILQEVAKNLKKDAIELTTALSNHGGWSTYLKAGFIYTGDIKNPLEVDATLAVLGQVLTERYRQERQMVYIINRKKQQEIMSYLKLKRELHTGVL